MVAEVNLIAELDALLLRYAEKRLGVILAAAPVAPEPIAAPTKRQRRKSRKAASARPKATPPARPRRARPTSPPDPQPSSVIEETGPRPAPTEAAPPPQISTPPPSPAEPITGFFTYAGDVFVRGQSAVWLVHSTKEPVRRSIRREALPSRARRLEEPPPFLYIPAFCWE